jgi:Membrane protein involved in colicin uptake
MVYARYSGTAVDTAGNVLPNATVEVRLDVAGRPARQLYADRSGTQPLGNPIQADAQGRFGFYVRGGAYYLRIYTGPSQEPTRQFIDRHVAIGTAAEMDVEDLASALEAGTARFDTIEQLQAFVPPNARVGAKINAGPEAGFYRYDEEAEEGERWVFERTLFDTLARMNVTGGTANAIEAEIAAGVDPANVVMLLLTPEATNTGAVTINGTDLVAFDGSALEAGWLVADVPVFLFVNGDSDYQLTSDVRYQILADEIAETKAETVAARDKAEQWADEDEDVPVETGLFSAKHHAIKAAASADSASEDAGTASTAAGTATGAAEDAVEAKEAAEALYGDLTAVEQAKDDAVAAAEASGDVVFFDTKADATAALGSLADQQVVRIFADESKGGAQVFYRMESGSLVEKVDTDERTVSVTNIRLGSTVSPEMFGALGNEGLSFTNDDMGAFQRAANYLHSVGGGTLLLTKTDYYLSSYTGADVDNAACFQAGIADATVSKIWLVPANVRVQAVGQTTLHIEGGSSSPFGYSTSANVLVFCGEEEFLEVTAATNSTRTATLPDTTGLSVGQTVNLSRRGGIEGGIPYTPSQERAPHQFLTIDSIVANTSVKFKEAYIHDFEAAQDLRVCWPKDGVAYPRNVFFDGVKFKKRTTSGYVLISRAMNVGFGGVEFEDTGFSFGMCQEVRVGSWKTRSLTENTTGAQMTIESCSDVSIGTFSAEGNGSDNSLGPLFFSDNCRDIHIGKYTANRWDRTGFAAFYSFDGRIDEMTLIDCGTAASGVSFDGALTAGQPAVGTYGSRALAEADLYKKRNLGGNSRLSIGKLKIVGNVAVPVRLHDIDADIETAYIEFANPGNNQVAPFFIGQSGDKTADATYYPLGGETKLRVKSLEIKTKSGDPAILSNKNGISGLLYYSQAMLAADALAGQASITLVDASVVTSFASTPIYFINPSQAGATAATRVVSNIAGNVVTFTVNLTETLPAGTKVWLYAGANEINKGVHLDRVVMDGVEVPALGGDQQVYPTFSGASAPYAASLALAIPTTGDWLLSVHIQSGDKAHSDRVDYVVTYDTTNASFPYTAIAERRGPKARTAVAIGTATASGGVVTIPLESSAAVRGPRVTYRWRPDRRMLN